jgi:hypothetical protein
MHVAIKMKMTYINTSKLDRLLCNGYKMLSHLVHLGAKKWPCTIVSNTV